MLPHSLLIEDFMAHRYSHIDFTKFSSALIVGTHKNDPKKSNGTGKTTILSAIQYALYDVVPTSTIEKVIRDGQERCCVTFVFELGETVYQIVRGRSAKAKEITLHQKKGDEWVSISGRTPTATNKAIQDLIKISSNAFKSIIKFSQGDLSGLSEPGQIKGGCLKIIEEPLRIEKYAKLKKIGEEKNKPVRKAIDHTESVIETLGEPKDDIKSAEADLEFCQSEKIELQGAIDKSKTSIAEKQAAIAELKQSVNAGDSEKHSKIAELDTRSKSINDAIAKESANVSAYEAELTSKRESISEFETSVKALEDKEYQLRQEEVRSKDVILSEHTKTSDDEIRGNKILADNEADYRQANQSIPKDDSCTVCQQSITPEYRKDFEDSVLKTLDEKKKIIEDIKKNLKKCRNKKAALKKELDNSINIAAKLISTESEIKSLKEKVEVYKETVTNLPIKVKELQIEVDKLKSEYTDVLKRLNSLKDTVKKSTANEINDKIFSLTDEIRMYERSLSANSDKLAENLVRQGISEEKINQANINLVTLKQKKKELVELKRKNKIQRAVINSFGPEGIPKSIVQTVINELQIESNELLTKLRPGLELQFDTNLNIKYRVDGGERDYDQLSGGQKLYIALSLHLALANVTQSKIGVDIKMLLLDEADQSLDESGVDAFADVVRKLQDRFKILIITHSEQLKQRFSTTLLVEYDGDNGSTTKTVGSW